MKKVLLFTLIVGAGTALSQQEEVVSIAGNKVAWYSLEDGVKGTSDAKEWDIAFDLKAQDAAIRINAAYGTKLYEFPGGPDAWESINEENVEGLGILYNSDSAWRVGAFNQNKDEFFNNPEFDYGWGKYDFNSHNVEGYRIFIIKPIGGDFKKIWIKDMISENGGRYNVTIANVDGSDEEDIVIEKSDFAGQQYAYYSFEAGGTVNHEVTNQSNWDLLFSKYITEVTHPTYGTMPYPAPAGVLSHEKVEVARVDGVDVNSYDDWWNQDYSSDRNAIGWDWCGYNWGDGGEHTFTPPEDLVFFVKAQNGDLWKLIFTAYDIQGEYTFSKEKMSTASLDKNEKNNGELLVYPNPASTNISLVLNNMNGQEATIQIVNVEGKVVYQNAVNGDANFEIKNISVQHLDAGIYFVKAQTNHQVVSQKLILK